MKNFKRVFRIDSDRADGTVVMFIFAIPLFILLLGLSINTNSGIQNKVEYNAMAQTSAETAVKSINAKGSLGQVTVSAFINEYKEQLKTTQAIDNSTLCGKMKVNGTMRTLPHYEISLKSARGKNTAADTSATWVVSGNDAVPAKSLDPNKKYKVISADVYTGSQNLFSDFGLPVCQLHKSSVSAIAFGIKSDL